MALLIARAVSALPRTEEFFTRHGFSCVGLPIVLTHPSSAQSIETPLLIITSAAAVPYLRSCVVHQGVLACVGEHTAEALREAGWVPQLVGEGDAAHLAEKIKAQYTPCPCLHVAGDKANTAWYSILEASGFTVTVQQAYTTHYLPHLPASVQDALQQGRVQQVLLFSTHSAVQTLTLLQEAGFTPPPAVCLSAQVAQAWQKGGSGFIIASKPSMVGMLAVMQQSGNTGEELTPPFCNTAL